jgi:hypothetical protein
MLAASKQSASLNKGDKIRAKIEANRQKRLAIAEAMKKEAGVTDHEINREDLRGLAYIGTGRILSPEGQNMCQLYTVAHECGHIFLHSDWPGVDLPPHVMEMEAESYAHQAFREHGMAVPKWLSDNGRAYVQSWIDKDRERGIAIDPRVIAYAQGSRSSYELLRMVPRTWKLHRSKPKPIIPYRIQYRLGRLLEIPRSPDRKSWREELRQISKLLVDHIIYGVFFSYLALKIWDIWHPMPEYFYGPRSDPRLAVIPACIAAALVWTNLVMLWRTATRI